VKNIISLLLLIICTCSLQAQEDLPSIGVLKLDGGDLPREKVIKINKYVETAFYKSKRFNIVTRQLIEAIAQEREAQKENLDQMIIEQGRAIGADYIVKGVAKKYQQVVSRTNTKQTASTFGRSRTNISAKKNTKSAPEIDKIYTSTQVSFTIKIVNVKTGVIATEQTYKGSLNGVAGFVKKIVKETFPYTFHILEIMEMKGSKKAKTVLVDGGFLHGLAKGNYIKVYEVTEEEVDGRILKRESVIGTMIVKRVDTGGNFSLCGIFDGRKKILEKMIANAKLVCRAV